MNEHTDDTGTPLEPDDHQEPEEAEAPPQRIWDPKSGSWVSPEELEPSAAPARPAVAPWERVPSDPVRPEPEPEPRPEPEPEATSERGAGSDPEPDPPVRAEAEPHTGPEPLPADVVPVPREPLPEPGPARPVVPVGLTILVAAVTGAVLSVVAMLFVPGFVDRDRVPAASSGRGPQELDAASAAAETGDSVVNVAVTTEGGDRYGSGFAIDTGLIVTAHGVVSEATAVRVRGRFGAYVPAEVVGQDQGSGVALLRADVPDLEPAVLASSELLHPGDRVTVVGALPGAQSFVATASIASIGRPVQSGDIVRFNQMQLDTAGPLVTAGGIVVDHTMGAVGMAGSSTDTGGAQVVPIEVVRTVAGQLREGDEVQHPWIGVVTDLVEMEGSDAGRGLVVSVVIRGSPAQTAEVAQGDVIVAIDGRGIEGPGTMLVRTLSHQVGDQIRLTVLRDGEAIELDVRVGSQPSRV